MLKKSQVDEARRVIREGHKKMEAMNIHPGHPDIHAVFTVDAWSDYDAYKSKIIWPRGEKTAALFNDPESYIPLKNLKLEPYSPSNPMAQWLPLSIVPLEAGDYYILRTPGGTHLHAVYEKEYGGLHMFFSGRDFRSAWRAFEAWDTSHRLTVPVGEEGWSVLDTGREPLRVWMRLTQGLNKPTENIPDVKPGSLIVAFSEDAGMVRHLDVLLYLGAPAKVPVGVFLDDCLSAHTLTTEKALDALRDTLGVSIDLARLESFAGFFRQLPYCPQARIVRVVGEPQVIYTHGWGYKEGK
jgi:hypothetical protein